VTQPDETQRPVDAPAEPVQPAEQTAATEDLDKSKSVSDADANAVKGGVKKTMQTQ
jgi:hypothetical protein